MGKKDKKKKGLGKAKTEAKAAKKAGKAAKKARAADGEDVEAILAEILANEAKAVAVAEHQDVEPPSPRAAFTLVANPSDDDELIHFGGEHYTGDRAAFFNDLFVFNVEKRTWSRYDSPNRPPPRSSHAAAVHKSFMYIFGGEFSNPSLSQYRHYRDLWRLDTEDMSWERLDVRGGPTARSGHRMCVVGGKLVVFGGFFDTGFENKYLNDLYYVDLNADELKWTKVEVNATDVVPSPRSGFQWVPCGGDEVLLYGGYCREAAAKGKTATHKGKKKGGDAVEEALVARGVVLADAFRLNSQTMKWTKVKRSGYGPSARAGFSMVLHKRNAVLFGGVEDDETEEDLESTFYNDMFALNMDRRKWFPMTLRKKKGKKARRRKRKDSDASAAAAGSASSDASASAGTSTGTSDNKNEEEDDDEEDDGKELDTAALEAAMLAEQEEEQAMPCGRFNAMVAVQKNVMYIAGGMVEKGDQEVTLDDIWAIDLNKLDEFHEVKPMSKQCLDWVASDDEDDEDEDDGEWEEEQEDDGEGNVDENEAARRERRGGRRDRLRERIIAAAGDGDENDGSGGSSGKGPGVGDAMTPRVNESLKDFFERSKKYWIGEVHEALGESGKALRRVAFEWAFRRYNEIKPTLRELELMETELAAEAEAEAAFARKQADQKRARSRR